MSAYYNENEPKAAAWLGELIKAGHIAPGEVDERSIVDVRPSDLAGFVQCHFFAGIGVWSYSLRRAGWPDDKPVWTGSCPCQPFSAAGKGGGFADERHLWPSWHHLIRERRPPKLFGEQVASKHADAWLDLVQDDLEAMDYAFGAVPFPSASVGAPHIRDRTYWMADTTIVGSPAGTREQGFRHDSRELERPFGASGLDIASGGRRTWSGSEPEHSELGQPSEVVRVANGSGGGRREYRDAMEQRGGGHADRYGFISRVADPLRGRADNRSGEGLGPETAFDGSDRSVSRERLRPWIESEPGRLADADGWDAGAERQQRSGQQRFQPENRGIGHNGGPGPVNGLWRDADWIFCRDGKWRPVESGTFPLAHGAPARVGRLRGYGNAINAEAAAAFIKACIDVRAA